MCRKACKNLPDLVLGRKKLINQTYMLVAAYPRFVPECGQ